MYNELKRSTYICMINYNHQPSLKITSLFLSYNKIKRFYTIMLRFKNYKLKKGTPKSIKIILKEFQTTGLQFLKCIQREIFSSEKDSKLSTLQDFTYSDDTLCLKTRIVKRNDNSLFLYPILLRNYIGILF